MVEVVQAAQEPYGWDAQICYVCQGGPGAARYYRERGYME